jgi:hypothetical protein
MSDTDTLDKPKTAPPAAPPEPRLPVLLGGGGIKAIIPQNFEEAYKMARIIAASGTAPKSYLMKDPTNLKEYLSVERIAVAIMHGLEVGLPPMQAVQGIAVINGMPTVYADAQDALVEASGLLEDRVEEHELDDQGLFLWWRCTVWRKGRKTPIEITITRPQAARAGWLKKQGPWQESPNRMAQRRARGWAYRDAFPDVLKGLVDRDEAMEMVDVTPRGSATTTAPPPPRRNDFQPAPDQADQSEPEKWELFDEVGEQIGEFEAAEWISKLVHMASGNIGEKERAQLLENNADTAKTIWEAIEDQKLANEIKALYTPAETEQQPTGAKDWSLPDSIVGQEKKLLAIYAMLDGKGDGATVETPAEVDMLWEAHEAFFDKLGTIKKAAANQRFGDRKRALAQAQAA